MKRSGGRYQPAALWLRAACLLAAAMLCALPARAQPDTLIPSPGDNFPTVQPEVSETPHIQLDLLPNFEVRRLRSGIYQVDREALARLRTGELAQSVADDSVRLFVAERPGPIEEVSEPERRQLDEEIFARRRNAAIEQPAPRARPDTARKIYRLPHEAVAVRNGRVTGHYQPIIEVPTGGLVLAEGEARYRGTLYIGVQDSMHPTARRSLPEAIEFQVMADEGEVQPSRVPIRHSHVPFEPVTVRARDVRDSVRLRVWTSLSPRAMRLPIGIRRPNVRLTSTPSNRIPGLGLGTARLNVTLDRLGSDSPQVSFSSDLGSPSPDNVSASGGRSNEATIRSAGLGIDTVTAAVSGYNPGNTVIRYVFPWSFLIATLLGGLTGSTLSYLRRASKEDRDPRLVREILGGLLAAVVVAVAYTVGVNLLQASFTADYGEALFFTLAALGAFGWKTIGRGNGRRVD